MSCSINLVDIIWHILFFVFFNRFIFYCSFFHKFQIQIFTVLLRKWNAFYSLCSFNSKYNQQYSSSMLISCTNKFKLEQHYRTLYAVNMISILWCYFFFQLIFTYLFKGFDFVCICNIRVFLESRLQKSNFNITG